MIKNEITKAIDILDKLDFFYGQRAGRELWFEKSVEAQEEDIKNFSRDIVFLKELLNKEVKHGTWLWYSSTMMECSNCKRHTARHKFEYCPHCGAEMEEK